MERVGDAAGDRPGSTPFAEDGLDGGVLGAVGELVYRLAAGSGLDAVLADVAAVAGHSLSVSSSLTVERGTERGTQPTTLASSDAVAATVDRLQYELGAGPCLETLHTGRTMAVQNLRAERRWQPFPSRATEEGVRSCLSVPLATLHHGTVAALNLYSATTGTFENPADVARVTVLALLAGLVVDVADRTTQQEQLIGQLREALISRSVIDQAVGVLMAQRHCDAGRAMDLLRQTSQRSNRRVRTLAADIVSSCAVPAERRPDS